MTARRATAAMLLAGLLWAAASGATEPGPAERLARDVSRIDEDFASNVDGRTAVNIAAGAGNAQANVATLAAGAGESTSRASQQLSALVDARDAVADIGGSALASGRGLTSINQAAGAANAQANLIAIGIGAGIDLVQAVDVELAGVATGTAPDASAATEASATREARIGGAAFQGPQGVLQINQTAGTGNASANAIVLQIPGGAP
ncbi:MAG: hypothetical protein ACOY37_01840 [Pseudomonadota bacterium]